MLFKAEQSSHPRMIIMTFDPQEEYASRPGIFERLFRDSFGR
jgi:hypothetical protein